MEEILLPHFCLFLSPSKCQYYVTFAAVSPLYIQYSVLHDLLWWFRPKQISGNFFCLIFLPRTLLTGSALVWTARRWSNKMRTSLRICQLFMKNMRPDALHWWQKIVFFVYVLYPTNLNASCQPLINQSIGTMYLLTWRSAVTMIFAIGGDGLRDCPRSLRICKAAPAQIHPSQDRKNIPISSKSNVKLDFSSSCEQAANER